MTDQDNVMEDDSMALHDPNVEDDENLLPTTISTAYDRLQAPPLPLSSPLPRARRRRTFGNENNIKERAEQVGKEKSPESVATTTQQRQSQETTNDDAIQMDAATVRKESLWNDNDDDDFFVTMDQASSQETTTGAVDYGDDDDDEARESTSLGSDDDRETTRESVRQLSSPTDDKPPRDDDEEAVLMSMEEGDVEQNFETQLFETKQDDSEMNDDEQDDEEMDDEQDEEDLQPEFETQLPETKQDGVARETTNEENEEPAPGDASDALGTQPPPSAAAVPALDDVLESTNHLFDQVNDKTTTVTIKDILTSLQAEFQCKLPKRYRAAVRQRLAELMTAQQQQESSEPDDDDDQLLSESDHDPHDDDHSEDDYTKQDTDDEDEEFTAKASRKKKSRNQKSTTTPSTGRRRPTRKAARNAAKLKSSALRIHAEQLRKRRMHELRVRNEELQLAHSQQDQERAQLIARKFDTNTDELRWKRLEQRIGLLKKLDQKRISVILIQHQEEEKCCLVQQEAGEDQALVEEEELDTAAAKTTEQTGTGTSLVNEESEASDDSSDDDDEDMELEFVGENASKSLFKLGGGGSHAPRQIAPSNNNNNQNNPLSGDALSILDLPSPTAHQRKKIPSISSPNLTARAALRNQLRAKQRQMGNMWLAQELGYKTEHDHLKECKEIENRKLQLTLRREQERLRENELRQQRLLDLGGEEEEEPEEIAASLEHDDDDDDEELVLARAVETAEKTNSSDEPASPHSGKGDAAAAAVVTEESDASEPQPSKDTFKETNSNASTEEVGHVQATQETGVVDTDHTTREHPEQDESDADDEEEDTDFETQLPDLPSVATRQVDSVETDDEQGQATEGDPVVDNASPARGEGAVDPEAKPESPVKPKGPRNAGWKALLEKDAEKAKKMKKLKGALVEEEADEEEEEEIAGLEDFGFTVTKKKNSDDADDEDGADDFNEEDLEHVVDELSDGEGDEDAGEKARRAMAQKAEKEQHKEMMRRMRDGYDGRRGGIASGGAGARGLHGFDQLVAADDRESAKRLGLLNDDEIDSEDEGGHTSDNDKEEDEAAVLDKMLKDRFLHRSSVELEEKFSDDEEDEDADGVGAEGVDPDELLEERMQERLAKRFEKRARMQRLLESRAHEEEFSQSRLLDDDASMKIDLLRMKNGLARKRSQTSTSSASNSVDAFASNKKQKTSLTGFPSGFINTGGALAIALKANRGSKSRTSFVRTGSAGSVDAPFPLQKTVALNHVVFRASENSQLSKSNLSSSFPQASGPSGRFGPPSKPKNASASLWSKAVVTGFQKRR